MVRNKFEGHFHHPCFDQCCAFFFEIPILLVVHDPGGDAFGFAVWEVTGRSFNVTVFQLPALF